MRYTGLTGGYVVGSTVAPAELHMSSAGRLTCEAIHHCAASRACLLVMKTRCLFLAEFKMSEDPVAAEHLLYQQQDPG